MTKVFAYITMPHFVIDCSANILQLHAPEKILREVHDTAEATGLFRRNDIKTRIRAFQHFYNGADNPDFIHVFANIMEGRSAEQKADLSKRIVAQLKAMFPSVPIISMNVREFEKATYCNRQLLADED